jgi:hypothetical protein
MTDYWCQTKAWKYGIIIPITRETLISDRLGQVVKMAEDQPAETKYYEDELAALAWADSANLGLIENTNDPDAGSYWPEGTNVPLYRITVGTTKPDYQKAINSCTNNLLHWDNLSKVIIMLRSMQNRKGSYINTFSGGVLTVVVPINIEHRARMIANPRTGVEIRANASAGTPYNILHTPEYIQNMGVSSVRVVPWILLTGASTPAESVWYGCGDCKKQFMKHRRWATEFRKASQAELGGSDFDADVLMKVRSGGNSGFRHVDDKFIVRNTNS